MCHPAACCPAGTTRGELVGAAGSGLVDHSGPAFNHHSRCHRANTQGQTANQEAGEVLHDQSDDRQDVVPARVLLTLAQPFPAQRTGAERILEAVEGEADGDQDQADGDEETPPSAVDSPSGH